MTDKPKTAAERKRLERALKRKGGRKKLELWVFPEFEEKIKSYVDKLQKKRLKA